MYGAAAMLMYMTTMRRTNLTISFDPEFVFTMDEARGKTSRGAWIEDRASALRADAEPSRPVEEPPTPKVERSPKPDKYAPNPFQRATQRTYKL
jgi:hypothetical protein